MTETNKSTPKHCRQDQTRTKQPRTVQKKERSAQHTLWEGIKDDTSTAPPKVTIRQILFEKKKEFSKAKNTSRVGPNSAPVYVKLSLCPAHILFTMMKDTACNFTEETRPDRPVVCAHVCGRCAYVYVYPSMHTGGSVFLLSVRLQKENMFFFFYLLRQEAGRMMKHLQCQLSPTPKNKSRLMKYIDTNTTLVFEAPYTSSVGRKLACYFGFMFSLILLICVG